MFLKMGLITKAVPVQLADWDFEQAAAGLHLVNKSQVRVFDTAKTKQLGESMIGSELGSLDSLVSLATREINFAANQTSFDAAQYGSSYLELAQLAQTHAGSTVFVEGNTDPSQIEYLKKYRGLTPEKEAQLLQDQRNKSLDRAQTVVQAFFAYCDAKQISVNRSQFTPIGAGGLKPAADVSAIVEVIKDAVEKKSQARLDEAVKMAAPNRRVVFRVQQVDSETSSLEALIK